MPIRIQNIPASKPRDWPILWSGSREARQARRRGRSPCWTSEERKKEADRCPASASAVNCTEPLHQHLSLFFSSFSSAFASKLHLPPLELLFRELFASPAFKTARRASLSMCRVHSQDFQQEHTHTLFSLRIPINILFYFCPLKYAQKFADK